MKSPCIMIRANSETWQTLVKERNPLSIYVKGFIRVYRVLNTPLMMTVARHWECVSTKTKILFSVLTKKTQSTFILDNGNTYKMNDGTNEKSVFLFEKPNIKHCHCRMKWRHNHLDKASPISGQCTPIFHCFPVLISNYSASILAQYSLAYSEVPFENSYGKKLHYLWSSVGVSIISRGRTLINSLKIT